MDNLGERLSSITRRLRTPTSGEWQDGDYIDAGLAMHLSSNASHAQRDALRTLVFAIGPGQVLTADRDYDRTIVDNPDPGTGYTGPALVGWNHYTGARFGPFFAINDRVVTDEDPGPRKLRVVIDCNGSDLDLVVAVTPPGVLPRPASNCYALETASVTGGRTQEVIDLTPDPMASVLIPCRGTADGEHVQVYPFFLWVGFYAASGANIYTITAYEVR